MKRQDGYLTRESGSWIGHYSKWPIDPRTGQKTRQQRAFKIGSVSSLTKTKAKDKLRERIVSEMGVTVDGRATFGWFVENSWIPQREGNWRDSTKAVNKELLKYVLERFGNVALEDMDGIQMQRWLSDLAKTRSASLVRHCHIFLRSIMGEATEQEYCRKNPARLLRVPKLRPVLKPYLSMDEVNALLTAAKDQPRELALLQFILVTALRPSELFALRWSSIDFGNRTMVLFETVYRGKIRDYTKTTQSGELPRLVVPDLAMEALYRWSHLSKFHGPEDFIFSNADGGFMRKDNYSKRVLKPLGQKAGVARLNFQILRRSVGTHAQHFGSLKDQSTIMRHKKMETTQNIYVQAITESVRATGNALAAKMLKPLAAKGSPLAPA